MTQNLLVMDVGNVYLEDLETGKIIGTTTASANAINSTLEQDFLRGGWGGGIHAAINSSKLVELSFSDIFYSMDYLSLQQGTEVEEGVTGHVLQHFTAEVKDQTGDLYVDVPTGINITSAIFEDLDGSQETVTVTTSKADIPVGSVAVVGDTVKIYYKKTITGRKVTFDSAKFPKHVKVTFHTRAFDPKTNVVTEDIYMEFDKCQVGGNSSIELGVNTPVPTEMTFTALNKDNSTEIGRIWGVARTA